MARFFVGQRVRLVKTVKHHYLLGQEFRVLGFLPNHTYKDGYSVPLAVDIGLVVDGRINAFPVPEQLEPILDQHTPCESEFKESLDKLLEGLPA